MFSSVLFADGGIAVPHFISLWPELCWHFSWSLKQSLQARIEVFKEAFKGFHPATLWISNLKHFTVGFVGVICQTTLMIFGCKGAAKLIVTGPLRYTPKNQHVWGELSLIFTSPFSEIKGYVKLCSAEELRRYPIRRVALFRTDAALFAPYRIFMNRRPNFPLLHHLFADSIEDLVRFLEGWVADYRPWQVLRRLP